MADEEDLVAQVQVGDKAKAFLDSDLGRYLSGCATQDFEQAKTDLFEIDPYKYPDLKSLQSAFMEIKKKGQLALDLQQYLTDAITNADQALHQLESKGE